MGKLKAKWRSYVDRIRRFLEDFYYISDRPNCLKMTEEDFRDTVKSIKKSSPGK